MDEPRGEALALRLGWTLVRGERAGFWASGCRQTGQFWTKRLWRQKLGGTSGEF